VLSRRYLIVTSGLAPLAATASNWPSFRGPNASGVAAGANIPDSFSLNPRRNVAWRAEIPGLGHSSPVVWGDQIFVTTAVSSDANSKRPAPGLGGIDSANTTQAHSYRVLCLDRQTGKPLWDREVHNGEPKIKHHIKASHANSSVATDGRNVIAFFGSEGLYGLDPKGSIRWKQDLGTLNVGLKGEPEVQWGFSTSPILYRNLVIVQCDTQKNSFVAAFDAATGKPAWRVPRNEFPSWSTPVVFEAGGKAVLITIAPHFVYGMDPLTGKEIWRYADETEVRVPAPVLAGDKVVISGGYPPGRRFFVLDAATGKLVWEEAKGGPYTTTPLVVGDKVYIISDKGVLSAHQLAGGKRVYQQRVPEQGGNFSASPVAAGGKIYLSSEEGDIHVVKAGPQFQLLASNSMGEGIYATPAISGGGMIVRTVQAVYSIQAVARAR